MRISIFFLVIITAFIACKNNTHNAAAAWLNADNIGTQSFAVNPQKNNDIVTSGGIKIHIPADAIETEADIVHIEIKEALNMADMLKAGLTTQTAKGILSSEGMFNISSKEKSVIRKPLQVQLPTPVFDGKMQLYKGVEDAGKITWADPEPIQPPVKDSIDGEALFMANCASCHAVEKKLTGPELAWIGNRWKDRKLLYMYIRNSQEFMKMHGEGLDTFATDRLSDVMDSGIAVVMKAQFYAEYLYCEYNKTVMTPFTGLTDNDIKAIIKYTDKRSKEFGIDPAYNPNLKFDSCMNNIMTYASLIRERERLENDNGPQVKNNVIMPPGAIGDDSGEVTNLPPSVIKVVPPSYNAEYYQFSINGYGWYNVDALLAEEFKSMKSELKVSLTGKGLDKAQVFLVIPAIKVFVEGGKLSDNNYLGFYDMNGTLPLPQGHQAYIIAMSEEGSNIYFGETPFITSLQQTITVDMATTSKEAMQYKVAHFGSAGLAITVDTTKNFSGMKAVDSAIGGLVEKMKGCRCMNVMK